MCVFFFFHVDLLRKKLNFAVGLGEVVSFCFLRDIDLPPKTL